MTRTIAHRADPVKSLGVHYTPPALAAFVAAAVWRHAPRRSQPLTVLDPACGDGSLLAAVAEASPPGGVRLVGCDVDAAAVESARSRLSGDPAAESVEVFASDFLDQGTLLQPSGPLDRGLQFDIVVANPPYVRTQTLGAERSRALAKQFGLSGRVDLYHAFALEMSRVLSQGGVMALLSSNRFMTIQSGKGLRRHLRQMDLKEVHDLGDTKIFSAAVLPAVTVATASTPLGCEVPFTSAYESGEADAPLPTQSAASFLRQLPSAEGPRLASLEGRSIEIRRGRLADDGVGGPWTLRTDDMGWLDALERRTALTLGDVGPVRVGIKTTADPVFIRGDWDDLGAERPEAELLMPLLTHVEAERWRSNAPSRKVLYPYDLTSTKRLPLDLGAWPKAASYLAQHRTRLEGRKYVVDAGREWWEIWVPQKPRLWSEPKIVFPDIAETPRFSLDSSGSVVNGDCYWVPVGSADPDLVMLAVAIANSTVATAFYDARCGNKLYSGRRRYISQYVRDFPLPDPGSAHAARLVDLSRSLSEGGALDAATSQALEEELDVVAWAAFGLEDPRGDTHL